MITQTQCPPVDTLKRYSLGQYSDDEGAAIEQHLNDCVACEQSLASFDDTHDSLLRHLPLTGHPETKGESSGWMQRLLARPPADGSVVGDGVPDPSGIEGRDAEFGAYELTGLLGRGGMGVVYDARHRQLGRPVAIKVVDPKLVAAKEAGRRFHREIQVLGRLDHPGIVSATDAGKVGGAAYLVMERIDGVDLARLVRQTGPLSVAEACAVVRQVALALSAAHHAAAIHRDVKPSNVMIDRGGRVKLLDFGLAHLSESVNDRHDTSLGRLLGTLDYMAPEQAADEPVGPAADLYGLGATLFFLLTGRPPRASVRQQGLLQQLRALADDEPPRLKEVRADVPESLSAFVARLLARDPQARPSDAGELAIRMETWADENADESLRALVASAAVPAAQKANDKQAVAQSLLELLGSEAEGRLETKSADTPEAAGGRGRAGMWAVVGLGGLFAAVWLGIVLLIETPQGTLRIESEVEDIRVEVLDEDDRVAQLQIEGDAEETRLEVGKYRIRLAGGHETMIVQPDEVVLRRGEQVVARVVQQPKRTLQDGRGDVPIYRGEPLSTWQQRFAAETNPVARMEAAKALVAMTDPLSTEQRVGRVCQIGGEVLQSGWGEDVVDSLDQYLIRQEFSSGKWPQQVYPDLQKTWESLVELSSAAVLDEPPEEAAMAMVEVIREASLPAATFAAILLEQHDFAEQMSQHPQAVDVLISGATRPGDPRLDRHLVLTRSRFYEHASPDVQKRMAADVIRIGDLLAAGEYLGDQLAFAQAWFERTQAVALPDELRARIVLRMLLRQPGSTKQGFFHTRWYDDGQFPYPDQWMKAAREHAGPWWGEWIGVACDYLKQHPAETQQTADVIGTFNMLLRCRKTTDHWQTGELVEVLTDRLHARYSNAAGGAPEQSNTTSTHDLLSYIILAGGDIPDFVVRQQAPVADAEAYDAFLSELDEYVDWNEFQDSADNFDDLILSNPFQTVAAIVRKVSSFGRLPMGSEERGLSSDEPVMPRVPMAIPQVIVSLSTRGNGDDSPPPIEPLLLLAIATELTGESEAQDERIAGLFADRYPSELFRRHIDDALDYPFAIREVAETWLRRMHERAISDELTEPLEELMPDLQDDVDRQAKTNPRSLVAAVANYNRDTAELRETLFGGEIPDLTVQQLREAFADAATVVKDDTIAQTLRQVAETGLLPEGRGSEIVMTGPVGKDDDGDVVTRQIVPAITLPNPAGSTDYRLIPLRAVELIYNREGESSKEYGQPYKASRSQQNAQATQSATQGAEHEQHRSSEKQSSPEFPAVRVGVQTQGGEPLAGATVKMRLLGEEARPVVVTAESADNGIAIDRVLPYGRYYLSVKTATGWATTMPEVLVEFGKDFELTIVAPAPGEHATLVIDGRFKPADISGLRFGTWREAEVRAGAGYAVVDAPEPDVESDRYATFPTLGDGIEEVALSISIKVYCELSQPDGSQTTWSWLTPTEEHPRRFLLTTDSIYPIIDTAGEATRRREGTAYFSASENARLAVGYIEYTLGERSHLPTSLSLPAGRTVVYVTGAAGRPSAEVRQSLGIGEPSNEQRIWLPARLKRESRWVSRIMDLTHWRQWGEGESGLVHLARQEHKLKQGETLRVKIEPPSAATR